jgi:2-polyprenyl-6-methoxyphenol hydroxylase-like FAD-dependent oxidoreductase
MSSRDRKVCVVGGGPAGLAAAIALRREDCDVTVVDCAAPPIDKSCGEGLMPDTIAALGELGVEIPEDVGFAFRGIRFADARSSVFADFPNGIAKGVRRTVLHQLLIRQAMRHGVSIVWNAKHVRLTDGGVSTDRQLIEAQLVVGADGQNSQIRRQAALHRVTREKRRYGFRRHYRIAPWSSYMELHWGTSSQIYITPIAPDEICVVTISRDPKLRWEQILCGFPELDRRLRNVPQVSPEMGALSMSRSLRHVQRNKVALIGDASGSVDAITGEGMRLSFKQALALAAALRSGDIRQYQRLHRALMKHPQTMASLLLALERNGQLQRRVLAGLTQHPDVFKSLVAIHVGASSFRDLYSWRLLDFGRRLLTA